MTVTSNTTRNDYVAGTNQNVYNYTFQLNEASDVTVYLGGVVQTLNVHYTVQDVGVGTGGTITFTLVDSGGNPIYPTPGTIISILMTMELDRDTDYQPNGVFLASEVNNDYDRLWLATNQQQTAINRSLRLQDDDIAGASPSMELPLKDDRKGKILSFDAVTGEPITAIPAEYEIPTLAETLAEGNTTGGNDIVHDTNDKAVFGTGAVGSALEIYTDGTGSGRIENVGLGSMVLKAPNYVFRNDSDESILTLFQHRAASFKDNTGNTRMSVGAGKVVINDEARVYGSLRFDELATNTALDPGGSGGPIIDDILDEDDMASDSATGLATQQSIKAYVDSQVGTVDTLSEVLANGNTTGGNDIAFGDNDKATFGANTDLEIYSDASSSFINELGPGGLVVQGANVNIKNSSGQAIAAFTNARSSIFYDSGGIDRLTVRSGGITVDGQAKINGEVFFDSIQRNGINAVVIDDILDEDNMASDSATALATQQSIKAYVDASPGTTYTAGTGITLTGTQFSLTDTNAKLNLTGGTITSGGNIGLKVSHDDFQEGIISYRNHASNSASYVFENASGRTGTLYTQNDFPMWRDGTTSNSHKVWTQGNDGSGSGLDADTVDGKQASQLYRLVGSANGTAGAGWITVAQCTSNRYHGEVFVTDSESGDHSFIRIDWMRSYADTAFTVLNCGGNQNRITGVRVLNETADTTYGTKKLQVYVTTSSNYFVRIHSTGEVSHYGDLTAVTPVVQNTITGYAVQGAEIEDLDDYTLATHQGIRSGNGGRFNWKVPSDNSYTFFENEWDITRLGIGAYNGVVRLDATYGNTGGSSAVSFTTGQAGETVRITTDKKIGINVSNPTFILEGSRYSGSTSSLNLFKISGQYGGIQAKSFYATSFIGQSATAGHGIALSGDSMFPAEADNYAFYNDNAMDCGRSNARWDDVYATNGTIQTSDEREKQDIETLSDAEQRVAVAAKGLLRKFRWKDSVEEKGDNARTHFGIIAQDLQAAFVAEGLDPSDYAMFIKSEWWIGNKTYPAVDEVLDDEDNVVVEGAPEQTETDHQYDNEADAPSDATYHYRLGIRYSELLAFIIAAL